jgi:F-type H+-transporting ATPase subunit b
VIHLHSFRSWAPVLIAIALGGSLAGRALLVRAAEDPMPVSGDKAPAESVSAEAHGAGHEGHLGAPTTVTGPEEFKTDLAIYTGIVFLILLTVLWKFAWGPIVAGLEKREQRIAENIAAAERAHEEAKLLLAEYDRKLAGAAEQVRMMLEEARKDAEQVKLEIIAEAKEAAKLEFERSRRELQRATDQALKELSERATNLAVDLASKIVRAQLSQHDHARLVQEAMAEFVSSGPSVN